MYMFVTFSEKIIKEGSIGRCLSFFEARGFRVVTVKIRELNEVWMRNYTKNDSIVNFSQTVLGLILQGPDMTVTNDNHELYILTKPSEVERAIFLFFDRITFKELYDREPTHE